MPISFQCANCGKKLKAPDTAAGKSSKCPQCGQKVTCPEPIYEAEEALDAPEILDDVDPYGDLESDDPYAVEGATEPAESGESRRPCPMCGELIVVGAAKCRFCGEVFDATLKQAETKKKSRKKKRHDASDVDLSGGEIAVGVLLAGIGCIMGVIWMFQGKPKGIKMLGISICATIAWNTLMYFIGQAHQGPGRP